jgi:hypothetical protein
MYLVEYLRSEEQRLNEPGHDILKSLELNISDKPGHDILKSIELNISDTDEFAQLVADQGMMESNYGVPELVPVDNMKSIELNVNELDQSVADKFAQLVADQGMMESDDDVPELVPVDDNLKSKELNPSNITELVPFDDEVDQIKQHPSKEELDIFGKQIESDIFKQQSDVNEILKQIDEKRHNRYNFFQKYAPHYSHHELTDIVWDPTTMGDYPPEYVLKGKIQGTLESSYYYNLYVKKVAHKYYYLMDPNEKDKGKYSSSEGVQYYDPQFADEIRHFQDVTKTDYTAYHESDCLLGRFYFKSQLIKLALART